MAVRVNAVTPVVMQDMPAGLAFDVGFDCPSSLLANLGHGFSFSNRRLAMGAIPECAASKSRQIVQRGMAPSCKLAAQAL